MSISSIEHLFEEGILSMIMNAVKKVSELTRGAALSLAVAFGAAAGVSQDANAQNPYYGYDSQNRADEYYKGYTDGTRDSRYYDDRRRDSRRDDDRRYDDRDYDSRRERRSNCVGQAFGDALVGGLLGAAIGDNSRSAGRGAALFGTISALDCATSGPRPNNYYGNGYYDRYYDRPRYDDRRWSAPRGQNCLATRDDRDGTPILVCK